MLGGAYFQINRNGGYGKRNISFRAFPYPPFNVCFLIFPALIFLLILLKSFYRVFHDVGKTRDLFARILSILLQSFWLLMKISDNCPKFQIIRIYISGRNL
ncbi:hypothetical protein A9239_00605 [Methanosarcina sp. A14]|nr:hypothetical protein A9239_00605 [Methanosarcina sp. A14]